MGSARVQGELWGRAPDDWASLQEAQHAPFFDAMLDAAGVGDGVRVLDAGCGGGGASVLAERRGATVSGLDASAPLIDIARNRVPGGAPANTIPFILCYLVFFYKPFYCFF